MKLLQKIPAGIQLEQEQYEWQVTAQNNTGKSGKMMNVGGVVFKSVFLLGTILFELFLLRRTIYYFLGNIGLEGAGYVMLYLMQVACFVLFLQYTILEIKEGLERQQKVLKLTLKNEGFELMTQAAIPKKNLAKWYDRATLQEVFFNRGPQQKAAVIKKARTKLPQELYIRPKGAPPEAWGRFLREDQTKFLALLLRELYPQKKIDQQIPIAPPPLLADDDFEDLSRHLID